MADPATAAAGSIMPRSDEQSMRGRCASTYQFDALLHPGFSVPDLHHVSGRDLSARKDWSPEGCGDHAWLCRGGDCGESFWDNQPGRLDRVCRLHGVRELLFREHGVVARVDADGIAGEPGVLFGGRDDPRGLSRNAVACCAP